MPASPGNLVMPVPPLEIRSFLPERSLHGPACRRVLRAVLPRPDSNRGSAAQAKTSRLRQSIGATTIAPWACGRQDDGSGWRGRLILRQAQDEEYFTG